MSVTITLKDALGFLDPAKDEEWTDDGLPRVDVVQRLMDDTSITREVISREDPSFCREEARKRKETKGQADNGVRNQEAKAETGDSEIRKLDKDIASLMAERDKVTKQITELSKKRDRLQAKLFQQYSPESDTKARLVFIKKQNELKTERHSKGQKILQGVNRDILDPKSPLDKAMSRKNTRGTQRPTFATAGQPAPSPEG